MRSLKPTKTECQMYLDGKQQQYFIGVVLDIPRKATLAQVEETVLSRCFVGCLGQARKRCGNRCCCSPRNYASDVRPTDTLAAGRCRVPKSDPSSRSCVLHCYCVCVCVCFLPTHTGHQVRRTYQPGSHRRKFTPDFSSTFFLRCVP